MAPGPFGINSRPALTGAKYAEAHGMGEAYHAAIFNAYWLDGQDISDVGQLKAIAMSVGLAGDSFSEALAMESYQSAVQADIEQAFQYGLNGVPALVFENKYLVSGAQPYEVLTQVVEKIEAEDDGQ